MSDYKLKGDHILVDGKELNAEKLQAGTLCGF